MKKYAVIVAGGSGSRMGSSTPKQYLDLLGKPVLWYSLSSFLKAYDDLEIILVVAEDQRQHAVSIVEQTASPERILVTTGGKSRFHSVKNGLEYVKVDSMVFVHDGVRCLVSTDLVHRCFDTALKTGNAVPVIDAVDSIRLVNEEGNHAIDRKQVKLVQTPQTFYSSIIKTAFLQNVDPLVTDEASLVERLGVKIHLVEGESTNIKITTPIDMLIAKKILEDDHNILH